MPLNAIVTLYLIGLFSILVFSWSDYMRQKKLKEFLTRIFGDSDFASDAPHGEKLRESGAPY